MHSVSCQKAEAHDFLSELSEYLNSSLPTRSDVVVGVEQEVQDVLVAAKAAPKMVFREAAFVSRYITPSIHSFLSQRRGFDDVTATSAIISENRIDRTRGFANKHKKTAYPLRHPFAKSIGVSARKVSDRWFESASPLSSKHPDLCLTEPFRVLFEAKYVRKPTTNGRIELTTSIYEAFFYRGLAPIVGGKKQWVYDFAVPLMYDGTRDGAIVRAWNQLDASVRNAFWNAGNIYVMLLRGSDPLS